MKCESLKFDIEARSIENRKYRKVVFTGKHFQVVLMSLKPFEEIGMEIHEDTDQFFRVEKGRMVAIVGGRYYYLKSGDVIIVPAGTYHNIKNRSTKAYLKLYTIYAPPEHAACHVERNKKIG
jgi:mannose-6-phosphate isomerase-like protein (cupin superfamily)